MANPLKKKYQVGEIFHCRKCGSEQIAKSYMVKNGHYKCTKCISEYIKAYQSKNLDKVTLWRKRYLSTDAGKEMLSRKNKKFREANKEKYKAHWTVAHAKKSGKLKSKSCKICGEKKTHAHHSDYSEPLNVEWLCPSCHVKHHRLLLELEKSATP